MNILDTLDAFVQTDVWFGVIGVLYLSLLTILICSIVKNSRTPRVKLTPKRWWWRLYPWWWEWKLKVEKKINDEIKKGLR